MKLKFTLLAVAFMLFASQAFAQTPAPIDSVGFLKAQKAVIKKLNENIYTIEPTAMPGKRFVASNLPKEFRHNGMPVIVEGVIGKPKPNVRMAGTPFYIRAIRPAKDAVNRPVKPRGEAVNPHSDNKGKAGREVSDLQGVIVYQADTYLIKAGQRMFVPTKLDDKYKMDGLPVKFSGKVLPPPPNVRMMGTPIALSAISVARKPKPSAQTPVPTAKPSNPPKATPAKPVKPERHPTDPLNDKQFDYRTKVKKVQGTVQKIANIYVIDASDNIRYVPTNLPSNFKTDGLKVIFGGYVGKIPVNVRMAGLPLKLVAIKSDHAKTKIKVKKVKIKKGK